MESKMKAIANVAIFLVALFLITSARGKTTASVDINPESITLSGPDGYSYTVEYAQIKPGSVKLLGEEELDAPGSAVSGDENRRYRWGQWENDSWGTYHICILRKIDAAILFETADGNTVIFNVESEDTTAAFADAFNDLVVHSQSGQATA